jgi:3'-5' exoribonuclease
MQYIEQFKDGDRVSGVYLCKSKATALTKAGKEYFNVVLQDKTGQVDTKVWDINSGGIGEFEALDYVAVTGQVINYNGSLQFKLERARIAQENEYTPTDYIPTSRYDIDEMYAKLIKYVDSVKNEYLSKLLRAFFVEDAEFISKFKYTAAGKTVHHGYLGGLLEHSLSVTGLCSRIAENYDFLNRDLLITCALLHDSGKVRELSALPKNDYTDEGNFIGHIVMGYEMIREKIAGIEGFPQILANEVGHCILAHHGELEFGSPKKPCIAEALALSMADNMDAKLETLKEAIEAKNSDDWLGYNKWLDSNIKRTL